MAAPSGVILEPKKIRDAKGTFDPNMGTIKIRNGRDITEAEGIKKKCQEYTEELYKKDLHDPDNPRWCNHSARARHPGVQSQVALKKNHYEQSLGTHHFRHSMYQI